MCVCYALRCFPANSPVYDGCIFLMGGHSHTTGVEDVNVRALSSTSLRVYTWNPLSRLFFALHAQVLWKSWRENNYATAGRICKKAATYSASNDTVEQNPTSESVNDTNNRLALTSIKFA